jgi:hypothetical protein
MVGGAFCGYKVIASFPLRISGTTRTVLCERLYGAPSQSLCDDAGGKSELPAGRTDKLTKAQWKQYDAQALKEAIAKTPDVRPLSKVELEQSFGRGPYRNKYFAGTMPWHRSLRDVNLCNGNLFKSFTDIQVAPAKGAGLAMQRTYNSQDDRIGPFGQGWTHAYDICTVEENPATNYTDDSLNYATHHSHDRHCYGAGTYGDVDTVCHLQAHASVSRQF